MSETWIRGGKVYGAKGFIQSDLVVGDIGAYVPDQGAQPPASAAVIDARGLYVGPAFFDLHTHSRTPGKDGSESPESLFRSAVTGGFGGVVAMANTDPPIDHVAILEETKKRFERLPIQFIQGASVTIGRQGERLVDMVALKEHGAVFFSDDGDVIASARVMKRALEYSRALNVLVAEHAQDAELAFGGVMNEGETSYLLGVQGVGEVAESIVVARDLELNRVVRGNLHLMHLSTLGSLGLLRYAKDNGISFSSEVTPHHLLISDSELATFDTSYKVNPPLRSKDTCRALRSALREGLIDAVATDHAPHAKHLKERSIKEAPFGLIGLQSAFAATFTAMMQEANPDVDEDIAIETALSTVLQSMSIRPREILAKVTQGELLPNSFVVLNPNIEVSQRESDVESLSKNSPYLDRKLRGQVVSLIVGGKVVLQDCEIKGEGVSR